MKKLQAKYSFIQLLAQTMPPFPWHKGGRSFHNCLTTKESILKYIEITKMNICLDISHTALSANYYQFDIYEAISELLRYTAHLHIADASKNNQEGQQIGDGSLDFHRILKIYTASKKTYSFIPEIWQGHLNQGEGFHKALRFLEENLKE